MKTIARSCLAALVALLALTPAAQAQINATVPARVIKELDGTYKVEYRPTADGKLASESTDRPGTIPAYTRQQDGSVSIGIEPECAKNENGDYLQYCKIVGSVDLLQGGWQLDFADRISTAKVGPRLGHGLGKPYSEVLLRYNRLNLLESINKMHTGDNLPESTDRIQLVNDPDTVYPVPFDALFAMNNVQRLINDAIGGDFPQIVIRVGFGNTDGDLAQTGQFTGLESYVTTTNFGLLLNSQLNNEVSEEQVYSDLASTSSYRYALHAGGSIRTSTSTIVFSPLRSVLFGDPTPLLDNAPVITLNGNSGSTSAYWDFTRYNNINPLKYDFELTLMHEVVHALGFFSANTTYITTPANNAISLSDLFRVGPGEGSSGLFSLAVRRIAEYEQPRFVLLFSQNVPCHVESGSNWSHWLQDSLNGGIIVGIMQPDGGMGDDLPFLLYQNDLRALDIIGYNVSNFAFDPPLAPVPVEPVATATGVSLQPMFAWSPTVAQTRYIVIVQDGPNPYTSSVVGTTDLVDGNTASFPFQLSPQTQYWWAVSAVNGVGAYALSEVRSFTTGSGCDSVDFNNDTFSPDAADIDDFIAVLAGGPTACSTYPVPGCNDIDFNNDTFAPDSCDLDSLITAFSGGGCTPCGQ